MRRHWNHPELEARSTYSRRRFLLAGAVGGVPLVLFTRSGSNASPALKPDEPPAAPGTTSPPSTTSSSTTPSSTTSSTSTTTPTTTTTMPPTSTTAPDIDHDLQSGMREPKVERLQRRMVELAFDPGPVDGQFGEATMRAVWAFEKLVLGTPRSDVTGVVKPESWRRMNDSFVVGPRRTPGGTHVEVYLPEQVAALFIDVAGVDVEVVDGGTQFGSGRSNTGSCAP